MAGREDHLERQARELQHLPAADRAVRPVALERSEPWPRHEVIDVGQDLGLEFWAVDGSAGRARHRRDRADVVEVRVGDEDRFDRLDPEILERTCDSLRLVAGVDDHGPAGALGAHDEAVLLNRPDREHACVDHLPRALLRCLRRQRNSSM